MLKDIVKIKVTGDPCFGDTILDIFVKEENVLSCIYGKNGSGKTSFSKIIKGISSDPSTCSSNFLKSDDSPVSIEDSESIHIFNETYVDENVKAVSDKNTMDAILLFGETGSIDEEIQGHEETIKNEEDIIKKRDIEAYDNPSSKKSIGKARDEIKGYLQNSWASRQQDIRKNGKKSPVQDQTIDKVIEEKRTRKLEDVRTDFNSLFDSIKNLDKDSELVAYLSVDFGDEVETSIVSILNRSYDRKTFSELSAKIIEITNKKGLTKTLRESLDAKDEVCPICLQPLTEDHRKHLSDAIDEAFDQTIKDAIKKVDAVISGLNTIQVDLFSYSSVCDDKQLKRIDDLIKEYNGIVGKYCEFLETKKNNIYESLATSPLGLNNKETEIKAKIDDLNKAVKEHNDIIEHYNDNVKKLEALNVELSALEASSFIDSYKALIKEKEEVEEQNRQSKQKIAYAQAEINKLKQKKKDFSVAKNEINKDLATIFSTKDKLRLKEGEDSSKYYVYSKGKKVKLSNLSTGERNIIALCYFFEQLKSNSTVNDYFKQPMLVVIDDPISSFDYENKLSVFSYISKMIEMVLKGNSQSKVIVLSHERNVIYSLEKELAKVGKVTRRILNKSIVNFNTRKNSNYGDLLDEVYAFANSNPDDESFESKGNEVRKLLEAYSTFNYNLGPGELFKEEKLLSRIEDDDLRAYYKQSLNVLALHFDSHTEEMTKEIPYNDTFDAFSPEEQVLHAKNVLSYLYLIDELHIERYFVNGEAKVIKGWIKDVKNNLKNED